jgi:TonB family protein
MRSSAIRLELILAAVAITLLAETMAYGQTPSDSGTSPRALVQKARGSIAVVTGEDRAGQPIGPGLGFVIGRNLIATHNRVTVPALRLHASLAGQESSPINVSYSDSYRRATIMTVSTGYLRADSLSLGDSDKVAAKDRVYLFGDPGPQGEILEAVVRRITTINDKRYFELSAPFKESIDGGPVFNDKGEVIGILGESPDGPHVSLAVPASYLTTLLKARNPEAPGGSGSGPGSGVKVTTGPGYGAGSGGGMGTGRPPSLGSGQPSSGAGAGVGPPQSDPPAPSPVTTRPKALNSGRPQYSEIARRNQTQGVVMIRILVGADGDVKQAKVTKGLPDDLNERAVEAALKLKFQPAMRDGVAVDYTLPIQVEFNLR